MANRGVNKVILIGYLGQEPETRYMENGGMITSISIATTDVWKDKQTSEFREKTEWHRVVLFGKLADIAAEYLHKGSQVYIEGSLRTRKWQNQNGQDRYITEIIVNSGSIKAGVMQMLGGNNSRNSTIIADKTKSNKQKHIKNDNEHDDVIADLVESHEVPNSDDVTFNEDDIPF